MKRALLVALAATAGCDRVLGFGDIRVIPGDGTPAGGDGAMFLDAAVGGCPLDGRVPGFGATRVLTAAACLSYTIGGPSWPPETGGLPIAQCNGNIDVFHTSGPVPQTGPMGNYPRASTHGELLANYLSGIQLYTMTSQVDHWSSGQLQTFLGSAVGLSDVVSTPSGKPGDSDRRILLYHDSAALEEYMSSTSTANEWTMVATLDSTMLGVTPNGAGNLSSDGLVLVVPTATGVFYAWRASIATSFSMAQLVYASGAADESYPFLSADCQRLYITSKTDGNVYVIARVN